MFLDSVTYQDGINQDLVAAIVRNGPQKQHALQVLGNVIRARNHHPSHKETENRGRMSQQAVR